MAKATKVAKAKAVKQSPGALSRARHRTVKVKVYFSSREARLFCQLFSELSQLSGAVKVLCGAVQQGSCSGSMHTADQCVHIKLICEIEVEVGHA